MVILTCAASAMPLPMPVFLMPQASPAYLGGVELVLDGQQRGAHARAALDHLAGGGHVAVLQALS
jgi:hypothetical protein